jgi:hypothetical protein
MNLHGHENLKTRTLDVPRFLRVENENSVEKYCNKFDVIVVPKRHTMKPCVEVEVKLNQILNLRQD